MLCTLCLLRRKEENFLQWKNEYDELFPSNYEKIDYGVNPNYILQIPLAMKNVDCPFVHREIILSCQDLLGHMSLLYSILPKKKTFYNEKTSMMNFFLEL
ncbi:hypothetical protein ACH5RR_029585 [Cinchona calisaya]|uniref:Uncharacterized protein n=1 Tax=Cinchona calisaya TaxID=153742 RepID=A0ABD2YTM2_9GENT